VTRPDLTEFHLKNLKLMQTNQITEFS